MINEKPTIDLLKSVQADINALILQGIPNWQHAINACGKINVIIERLEKEERTKERAYALSVEEAKKRREQQKKEALERGETIIGGETVLIDTQTGEQKTIIE